MAEFKYDPNKRKTVEPSALQKRANASVDALARGATNIADNYAGGKGFRQVVSGVGAVTDRIGRDANRTRIAAGRIKPNEDETATGRFKVAPPVPRGGRTPGVAMAAAQPATNAPIRPPINAPAIPATTPTTGGRFSPGPSTTPGSGWMRNESTGETTTMGPGGRMATFDRSGNRIERPTRGFAQGQAGAGTQAASPYQISNLTGEALRRERFLNPTRPGTQMRSNLAGRAERMTAQPVVQEESRAPIRTFGDIMRRKEQMATERQRADIAMDAGRLALEGESNAIAREGNNLTRQSNTERNAIDRMQAESTTSLQGAQAENYRAETEGARLINDLTRQYQTADPADKDALRQQLLAAQGKVADSEQFTESDRAKMEVDLMKVYNDEKQGTFGDKEFPEYQDWLRQRSPRLADRLYGAQGGGTGMPKPDPSDIEAAKKDPALRQQFKEYFGADPDQFSA